MKVTCRMAFIDNTNWGSPCYYKWEQDYNKLEQIYCKSEHLLQIGAITTNRYTTNVTDLKHVDLSKP